MGLEVKINQEKKKKILHNKFNSIMMRLFAYPRMIKDMLIFFIGEPWVSKLDLDTVEDLSKDFISPKELDDFQSDMLWKIKLKDNKEEIFIYIHTEFQSTPDRLMPFRFLNYQYLVYDKIMDMRKKEEKDKKLPFVLPVLFYHGSNKWNFETDISKLIEIPINEALEYIPSFKFFKIMINEKTYEELSKYESVLAANFACNNVKSKEEFTNALWKVSDLLKSTIPKEQQLKLSEDIAKYLSFISKGRVSTRTIIDIINLYEEDKMTLAQLFEQEEQKGMEKGIEKGIEKKAIETAIKMLKEGVDIAFISRITDLSVEKIEELKNGIKSEN
jgi:predicted transposase/invertase (TIGR01784 family)